MKKSDNIKNYLLDTKEPYTLKIDNRKVEMTYSETNKSFKDCIVNILKRKMENETFIMKGEK